MKSALYISCVFAALLTEGIALSCYECSTSKGKSCTGELKTCSYQADTCLTKIVETKSVGVNSKMFERSCDQSSKCKPVYSFSNPLLSIRTATACCEIDGCTPAQPPVLPPASTEPNGVMCDWCYVIKNDTCSSQGTVFCNGDERKCIFTTAKIRSGTGSFMVQVSGCATEEFSVVNEESVISGAMMMSFQIMSHGSSVRPEYGLFLPALTGLHLLKVF